MPIRVNLLAEAQVAEEKRRRDPVKFAIYVGAFLVALMFAWSSYIQLQNMVAKKDLSRVQTQIGSLTNEYERVLISQKKIDDANEKLKALQALSTNRFLQGNLLDALQQATVEKVQLTRIRVNQSYFTQGAAPPPAGSHGAAPHPTSTEKIVVVLEARDSSANPGDQINKFKEAIANQSYFKTMLNKTNGVQLTAVSQPQSGNDNVLSEMFTVECNFPDQTRDKP